MDNLVNLERYEDVVRRLLGCGYTVSLNGQGYLVEHVTDGKDVSRCRHLADLVDLAGLFEWREQGRAEKSPSPVMMC